MWRDVLPHDETLNEDRVRVGHVGAPGGQVPRARRGERRAFEPARATCMKHAIESAPRSSSTTRRPSSQRSRSPGGAARASSTAWGPSCASRSRWTGMPEWRPLGAEDGVFDSADESVDADVSSSCRRGPTSSPSARSTPRETRPRARWNRARADRALPALHKPQQHSAQPRHRRHPPATSARTAFIWPFPRRMGQRGGGTRREVLGPRHARRARPLSSGTPVARVRAHTTLESSPSFRFLSLTRLGAVLVACGHQRQRTSASSSGV